MNIVRLVRTRNVQWPAPLSLLLHFAAQYKFLVIIILALNSIIPFRLLHLSHPYFLQGTYFYSCQLTCSWLLKWKMTIATTTRAPPPSLTFISRVKLISITWTVHCLFCLQLVITCVCVFCVYVNVQIYFKSSLSFCVSRRMQYLCLSSE